jgi:hypothetical protein
MGVSSNFQKEDEPPFRYDHDQFRARREPRPVPPYADYAIANIYPVLKKSPIQSDYGSKARPIAFIALIHD